MSQAPISPSKEVIELSRLLAPNFPWHPRVGDTFHCSGALRMVWQLPAPCHPEDFRILSLYEAKHWLRERGFSEIEISNHGGTWTVVAENRSDGITLTAGGGSDVEAALRLVLAAAERPD